MLRFPSGATLAQLVEHHAENVGVRSSILRGRTIPIREDPPRQSFETTDIQAGVAQLVEHVTRNDGVTGSIPVTSSIPGPADPHPRPHIMTTNRNAARPHSGDAAGAREPKASASDPLQGLMVSPSGVRGIVGQTLTPDAVLRVAGAHASFLDRGPVVVGRDTRPSGAWVSRLTQGALLASGHDVIDVGIAPTPTILFAIRHHGAAGGVAITASHNPAQWNALKLFGPGGTFLAPAQSEEVARRARQGRAAWASHAEIGSYHEDQGAIGRHRDAILMLPDLDRGRIRARRFRVVVDATNGAGSEATPALLEALGCEVERIFCEPDGRFPRVPEPLPENLGALGERVRSTGAAIGFANDPDADRLAIVDEKGQPIGEERTLQIAVDWALALHPGPVAVNASTSIGVDWIARRYGVRVHRTKIGEAHVAQKLIEIGGVIGGEGNGGVIYPALHVTRDGLLWAAIG